MEVPVVSVSPAFRQQVPKVVGSIVLFMIVYLLLILAAVVLAIFCFGLGFKVMELMGNVYGLLSGLGLMAVGVSVFVFLVKFLFSVSRDENSQRVEIREADQPKLFAFIRELTEQTGTTFPKRIFLSPSVNAAVFYDSSFWSMFLPTRKNLEIGLGLVNSVNITEFKAVMAHEFGHFSQRSMKLGVFTYNVNKVVHNMLYENTGYTSFLQRWGQIHSFLGLFAMVTSRIAQGIQWVLRGMYRVVNKSYLGLSREMEFHADAVAATVAGGNNVISSLSRSEVAGGCYQTALSEAGTRARENKVSRNIFANQLTIFRRFAIDHQLPLDQGMPTIPYTFVISFSHSRINDRNQWASHPTLEQRKRSLDALGIEKTAESASAWSLFADAEALQERMTANLYRQVTFEGETKFYENGDFDRDYLDQKERYALPGVYKGFYVGRYIDVNGWDWEALLAQPAPELGFEDLFNDKTSQLQQAIDSNNRDIELVMAINKRKLGVKSFDFDGVKYDREDGARIAEQLRKEVAGQLEQQRELEKQAFLYFVHRAGADGDRIVAAYRAFGELSRRRDSLFEIVNAPLKMVQPFYNGSVGLDSVTRILKEMKGVEEPAMKAEYRRLLEDSGFGDAALRQRMQRFVEADYVYFMTIAKQFNNGELDELRDLAIAVLGEYNEHVFVLYKKMLVEQLGLSRGSSYVL